MFVDGQGVISVLNISWQVMMRKGKMISTSTKQFACNRTVESSIQASHGIEQRAYLDRLRSSEPSELSQAGILLGSSWEILLLCFHPLVIDGFEVFPVVQVHDSIHREEIRKSLARETAPRETYKYDLVAFSSCPLVADEFVCFFDLFVDL